MVCPELTEFLEVATEAALTQSNSTATEQTIRTIAATSSVDDQWLRDLLARAWEAAVLQTLEDGVLCQKEEECLLLETTSLCQLNPSIEIVHTQEC